MNQKLLEKHRGINVRDGWYKCVIDDFKERMCMIGIEVRRVHFSGFASQGDGACFDGRVVDWNLFLGEHGYPNDVLAAHAQTSWRFSVKHHGLYYKGSRNCTDFDFDLPHPDNEWTDDRDFLFNHYQEPQRDYYNRPFAPTFKELAWLAVIRNTIASNVEDEFIEVFKGYMNQLYRDLEREHDRLTSSEAVWEAIVANELNIKEEQAA